MPSLPIVPKISMQTTQPKIGNSKVPAYRLEKSAKKNGFEQGQASRDVEYDFLMKAIEQSTFKNLQEF